MNFIWIGIGGFVGSCIRYLVGQFFRQFNFSLPIGTLIVNVLASFFIGMMIGLQMHFNISKKVQLFINTGLLGGLSTFSTFSLETVQHLRAGEIGFGILNIFLNVCICLIATYFGFYITK